MPLTAGVLGHFKPTVAAVSIVEKESDRTSVDGQPTPHATHGQGRRELDLFGVPRTDAGQLRAAGQTRANANAGCNVGEAMRNEYSSRRVMSALWQRISVVQRQLWVYSVEELGLRTSFGAVLPLK
jgi:hypothetical protein